MESGGSRNSLTSSQLGIITSQQLQRQDVIQQRTQEINMLIAQRQNSLRNYLQYLRGLNPNIPGQREIYQNVQETITNLRISIDALQQTVLDIIDQVNGGEMDQQQPSGPIRRSRSNVSEFSSSGPFNPYYESEIRRRTRLADTYTEPKPRPYGSYRRPLGGGLGSFGKSKNNKTLRRLKSDLLKLKKI